MWHVPGWFTCGIFYRRNNFRPSSQMIQNTHTKTQYYAFTFTAKDIECNIQTKSKSNNNEKQ